MSSDVPPTRMNQQIFKGKKKAAEGGHKLLKKKADALKVCFVRFRGELTGWGEKQFAKFMLSRENIVAIKFG